MSETFEGASHQQPDLRQSRRQKTTAAFSVDRLPPHSTEAEQCVIGCILMSPNDCMAECIQTLGDAGKEAFYDLRHQTMYDVLTAMYDSREAIDLITFHQRLTDKGLIDQIGGIPYLSQAQDMVPSAANLSYYLEYVREKWLLRQVISVCCEVVGRIYDYEGEVDTLIDEVERDILKVAESRVVTAMPSARELVNKSITAVEEMFNRKGISGIETGFPDLDKMTDGLRPAEMIVIAARPSMGKTSLAMNIVEHVTLELKLPVGVFSLEMSAESLMLRTMCSNARVNLRNVREGFMVDSDFPKLTAAAGRLSNAKLFIDDTAGLSILQLRARARRMHQQHGIKLFVIDYLQLLHSSGRRAQDNRQQEIADISSGVKALAKELKVPVIVLSQLNRDLEKNNRKPRLSDLRESGAIEQDADLVGLLYKPGDKEESEDEGDGISVNLNIAKQRSGPTGDVNFTFLKPYTRFESASRVAYEDVPLPYKG